MEAVNLVHKYFTCLRQQATNDAELCSTTVKACSVGFTPEMTAELSSSDKGLKFMESSISILSAVIEYSKGTNNKLGCVVRMVVVSMLPHAERGPNDHRKDAPPFMNLRETEKLTIYES